jgi:hypothetical protein
MAILQVWRRESSKCVRYFQLWTNLTFYIREADMFVMGIGNSSKSSSLHLASTCSIFKTINNSHPSTLKIESAHGDVSIAVRAYERLKSLHPGQSEYNLSLFKRALEEVCIDAGVDPLGVGAKGGFKKYCEAALSSRFKITANNITIRGVTSSVVKPVDASRPSISKTESASEVCDAHGDISIAVRAYERLKSLHPGQSEYNLSLFKRALEEVCIDAGVDLLPV